MMAIWRALLGLLSAVPASFLNFLALIVRRIRYLAERAEKEDAVLPCLPVPAGVWLQPDAYLYSQSFLMSLGLAVTWDNPDVTITDAGGRTVGSHDLLPSTAYRITALIHNRSVDAPAPNMPVVFTPLAFGAGAVALPSMVTTIDLPVRSAPGEPAAAEVLWRTPSAPGHYCIQIQAVWPDDANPADNIGQHNTVIRGVPRGDRTTVRIPVRHDMQGRLNLIASLDGYVLPTEPLRRRVGSKTDRVERAPGRLQDDDAAFLAQIVAANGPGLFPASEKWRPALSAHEFQVESGTTSTIEFGATAPPDAAVGTEQRFNVGVRESTTGHAVGGVTVILQVT